MIVEPTLMTDGAVRILKDRYFKRMIADIESGKINTVITKDLSRLGRDYLQTGYYTEVYFPGKKVRYIAISDGIDTSMGYNEMAPFKNLFNDFYARDISKKSAAP